MPLGKENKVPSVSVACKNICLSLLAVRSKGFGFLGELRNISNLVGPVAYTSYFAVHNNTNAVVYSTKYAKVNALDDDQYVSSAAKRIKKPLEIASNTH